MRHVTRRTLIGAATVLATIILGSAMAVSQVATASPSAATARTGVIIDGHARFGVLSPTLIRMEYAGDDHFQDAATFNVVNRGIDPPPYMTCLLYTSPSPRD